MKFTTITITLLSALLASAAENPFIIPSGGLSFTAGKTTEIRWDPTTSGTVTIVLRSGASSNLDAGVAVVEKTDNDGSYSWTVPSSITRGSDYALQIISDSNPDEVNYTPQFVIESSNTVASSTALFEYGASAVSTVATTSKAASTSKASTSTHSSSASASASASASESASASASSAATASASASSSHSASSSSASASASASGSKVAASSAAANASSTGTVPFDSASGPRYTIGSFASLGAAAIALLWAL